jgi:hypothetical protein
MQFATLRRLAALALIVAAPAAMAQTQHTTGTVTFRVFGNGYFGNALGVPATGAFAFNGVNGLFEGQLMVGVAPTQVAGQPYAPTAGPVEWTVGAAPTAITPPTPFDQAFQAGPWTDGAVGNPNPIGLSVSQRSYSSSAAPNNDFAIVELAITNLNATALPAVYIGIFADWDVGPTAVLDLAGYDATTKLLYVFDNSAGNPNYYGVALLGGTVSGYTDDAGAGSNPNEAAVWAGLTTVSPMSTTPADRRTIIGSGPYAIGAGASQTVRFAWVGGSSQSDIIANAAAAQSIVFTAAEGGPNAAGYALSATAPNPVSGSASMTLTIPTAEHVRVAVYDVTGREVSVLVDETRAAGTHPLSWDASALRSGVYLVRLTAGSQQISRTVSVAR